MLPASSLYTMASAVRVALSDRVTVLVAASKEATVCSSVPIFILFPAVERYAASASFGLFLSTKVLDAVVAVFTLFSTLWENTFASVDSTNTTPKRRPISPEYICSAQEYFDTSCQRESL